ncbi:MAG: hypothetical protein AAFX65_10935 [Cyanobacteria bacterium J06638_7]
MPPLAATVGLSLLLAMPAKAARYEAICGEERCTIEVSDRGVEGPAGLIPPERIVQWNAVGWKNHNALVASLGATGGAVTGTMVGALATCWTLIACPIGILAGAVVGGVAGSRAGKTADYQFSVEGYDVSGRKLTENFRFINARPVPGLVDKLTQVSGLEMGVQRDVAIAAPKPTTAGPSPRRPVRGGSALPPPPPRAGQPQLPAPGGPAAAPPPSALPAPAPAPVALEPALPLPQGEMPILYDAIDPYQGTPLFP